MFLGRRFNSMNKGWVSVILPNYNGSAFLKRSIESVLNQTYKNLELILVDDASTDNSKEIIESFHDNRIKAIYLPQNGQICAALNLGLNVAKGEYIARIDSDDIWEKNKLEKQIRFLSNNEKAGACFTYVELIDAEENIVSSEFNDIYNMFHTAFNTQKDWLHFFVFHGNCLSHPSAVIKRSVLEEVGYYNLAFVQAQDYELWMRIAVKYNLCVIPEELVKYRWIPDKKQNISADTEENNVRFYNEHLLAVYRFFQNISGEDFCRYFKDLFINKEAKSEVELLCEKAFLCLKYDKSKQLYPIGLEILEQIFRKENGSTVLLEKYNFSVKDFYKINTEHLFYDVYLKKEIEKYKYKIQELTKEIQQIKLETAIQTESRIRAEYEETKSWKITAPVRKGGQKYRAVKSKIVPAKFYLLGTEDYGNIGDHAIAIAEKKFLKHFFPKMDIIEVPASLYFQKKEKLLHEIREKDIIIGHGGGNVGNQYPVAESIRRDIVQTWSNNYTIIFPQTIFFTQQVNNWEEEIKKSQAIYNAHKKLLFFAREKISYEFAKAYFKCDTLLTPDIVFFMHNNRQLQRKDQIVICLRGDVEKVLDDRDEKRIVTEAKKLTENVIYTDTQKNYNISTSKRNQYVSEFLGLISTSRLLITDRMHGMIFAAITGTPCLVFDNYNSKIKGTYDWIRDLPYIMFLNNVDQLEEFINRLYNYQFSNEDQLVYMDKFFRDMAYKIKQFIKR